MSNKTCVSFSTMSTTGLPIIYGLMFLPSAFGNVISLWIFCRLSRRSSTHIYLLNLAISNIVVTTGMPFQIVHYAYTFSLPYETMACSIVLHTTSILTHCSMCVSISIFCWIAISRYATLVRYKDKCPHQSGYEKIIFAQLLKTFRNPNIAGYLCACVWLVYFCLTIPVFLVKKDFGLNTCCAYEAEFGQERSNISSITQSTCFFIFFFIVIMFYWFFITHIKMLQANSCIEEKHFVHKRVKNNIIVIVVLLLICFAPYHFIKFILVAQDYSQGCEGFRVLVEIKNCCLCLAEFRSCTDPIVYFCLDETYQKTIQRFFKNYPNRQDDLNANRLSITQTPTATGRMVHSTMDESCS